MAETVFEKASKAIQIKKDLDLQKLKADQLQKEYELSVREVEEKLMQKGLRYVFIPSLAHPMVIESSRLFALELLTNEEAFAVFKKYSDIGFFITIGIDNRISEDMLYIHPKHGMAKIVEWLNS